MYWEKTDRYLVFPQPYNNFANGVVHYGFTKVDKQCLIAYTKPKRCKYAKVFQYKIIHHKAQQGL